MSDSLWPHGLQPARLLCPSDFPGKNTGVHCHFLLQGIFPTRDWTCVSCIAGSLLHRKQIHYHWGTREAPTSMLVPQKQKICLVYFITMLCFKKKQNKTKQNWDHIMTSVHFLCYWDDVLTLFMDSARQPASIFWVPIFSVPIFVLSSW